MRRFALPPCTSPLRSCQSWPRSCRSTPERKHRKQPLQIKGGTERIIKGAFTAVVALTAPSPAATGIADELEKQGFRVLAVAEGSPDSMQVIGLVALSDPPRTDSISLISELHTLGVGTVMVTAMLRLQRQSSLRQLD